MKFFDRYPLRVLLVAATVALVALGLFASSAAVTLTMRSQLIASEVQRWARIAREANVQAD